MGVCVLYAGECQGYPEYERLPNDWPHNADRTHGTRGKTQREHRHLSGSVRNTKVHRTQVRKNAWINDFTRYLTELGYNKTVIWRQFFLYSVFLLPLSVLGTRFTLIHSYWSLFPTILKAFSTLSQSSNLSNDSALSCYIIQPGPS